MKKELSKRILNQTRSAYLTIANDFANKRNNPWPIMQDLAEQVKPNSKLLDWGCGHGRLFPLLQDKNIIYSGIDNCKPLVEKAQERYKKANWLVGSDCPENNFDYVVAIAAWHHIPGHNLRFEKLNDFYNCLNPGGYLLMVNWNFMRQDTFWFWLKNNLRNLFSGYDWNDMLVPWRLQNRIVNRYYHSISKSRLLKQVKKAGFEVKDCFYETKGQRTNFWHGQNIVIIAKKV